MHWGAFSDLGCKIYTQQLCRHDIADQQVSEVCMRRTCKASRGSVKGASRNPLFVNDRKGQSEPRLVVHDECHWLSASKQHDSPTAQRRQTRRPKLSSPLAFPEVRSLIRYASAMSDAIHVCEVSSKGEATKSQPAEFDAATGANPGCR